MKSTLAEVSPVLLVIDGLGEGSNGIPFSGIAGFLGSDGGDLMADDRDACNSKDFNETMDDSNLR